MEITVFDWNWRITVMAKKAANIASQETAPLVKKPAAPRARKHVKAQAVAAVAAVEEFVSALVHPVVKAKPEPTHEDVSRLAYRFYLERGGQNGSPAEDWARAEQSLRA
jgi:hypothetical protein